MTDPDLAYLTASEALARFAGKPAALAFMNGYVAKPIEKATLYDAVSRWARAA